MSDSFWFVAATESVDSARRRLRMSGANLKKYTRRSEVFWCHDTRSGPIGRTRDLFVDGDRLIAEITFDTSDVVGSLAAGWYRSGRLSAVSVAADIRQVEVTADPDHGVVFDVVAWTLDEISAVVIPDDPGSGLVAAPPPRTEPVVVLYDTSCRIQESPPITVPFSSAVRLWAGLGEHHGTHRPIPEVA